MRNSGLFLSLGTNIGDRHHNLMTALGHISSQIGKILKKSSVIETVPWGYNSDNMFLNMAIQVETELSLPMVLSVTQHIEKEMGRSAKTLNGSYSDRIIDLDILLFNNVIVHTDSLCVPHNQMEKRLFVLQPLAEIAPDVVHPIFHKTISQLLTELNNGR